MDIDLAKELARAKTHWADVSSQLEEKDMELKQALEREAFVVRELRASRDYVTALEHKVKLININLVILFLLKINDFFNYLLIFPYMYTVVPSPAREAVLSPL